MIDKQIISYLRVFHGLFNITIMLLFIYHGKLGSRSAGRDWAEDRFR